MDSNPNWPGIDGALHRSWRCWNEIWHGHKLQGFFPKFIFFFWAYSFLTWARISFGVCAVFWAEQKRLWRADRNWPRAEGAWNIRTAIKAIYLKIKKMYMYKIYVHAAQYQIKSFFYLPTYIVIARLCYFVGVVRRQTEFLIAMEKVRPHSGADYSFGCNRQIFSSKCYQVFCRGRRVLIPWLWARDLQY